MVKPGLMKTHAFAAASATSPVIHTTIERREVGPLDVQIDVLFSAICHSDIHQVRGDWGGSRYPMVPGHEVVGRVTRLGPSVTKFKVGDLAGVGCMVDSCRSCESCGTSHEMFCEKGPAFTYNSTEMDRVTPTLGGYSSQIVVTEHFVLKVPESLDPAGAAPLLCAGITSYSALREWHCGKGTRVAVVGLGGLGHMAVKLANAMGAEVTMLSTSPSKQADASRLGAHEFELTSERATFKKLTRRFDLIINTISAQHDYNAYLRLLRPFGTMALVGIPPKPIEVAAASLVSANRRLTGSNIGGIKETQEMLDFCATHKIVSDIERIEASKINEAYERVLKSDVRYRFVIDAASFAKG